MDWSAIKMVWSYSSFQFLSYFANYFSRNIDKLIIGKYFSLGQLGYYEKSYRLMQLPLQNITYVISPVLHPVLSSLQDQKSELGAKNKRLTEILSQISFPLGMVLYFCAYEIIMILFGENWKPAVPIFQILAISVPLQMILSTSGALYQAAGRTNHMFFVGILNTAVTVSGFFIAARCFKTLEAMAWAWDITLFINFMDSYLVMNKMTFGYSSKKFFYSLIPQIINSAVTLIISIILINILPIQNLILSLLYKVLVIGGLTVGIAGILKQYNVIMIIQQLLNKQSFLRDDNTRDGGV